MQHRPVITAKSKWTPPSAIPNKYTRCPRCLGAVHPYANLRKHKRGLTCKRRYEDLRMQKHGLVCVDDWKYPLCLFKNMLIEHVQRSKYGLYVPRTIVTYVCHIFRPADRCELLTAFLRLNSTEQQAHLDGVQLTYELWRETVGDSWWLLDEEIPF